MDGAAGVPAARLGVRPQLRGFPPLLLQTLGDRRPAKEVRCADEGPSSQVVERVAMGDLVGDSDIEFGGRQTVNDLRIHEDAWFQDTRQRHARQIVDLTHISAAERNGFLARPELTACPGDQYRSSNTSGEE